MHRAAQWLSAVLFLTVASASTQAHEYRKGDIFIDHPWARPTPPTAKTGAAYFIIRNDGKEADTLLGAKTPLTATVELHRVLDENGVLKMRKAEGGIEIPAGQTVKLETAGTHMMLIGLKEQLKEGARHPLTLVFKRAGEVPVELAIEKPAPQTPTAQQQPAPKHQH